MFRVMVVAVLLVAGSAMAQSFPASGAAEHLWAVTSDPEEAAVTLWHRAAGDPPAALRRVEQLRGRLLGGVAVAAAEDAVWLVYRDGSVQHVRAVPAAIRGHWVYHADFQRNLPADVRLRSLTADAIHPWALVTADSPQTLASLDAASLPDAPRPDDLAAVLDLPAALLDRGEERKEPQKPQEPGETSGASGDSGGVDRLLVERGGRWRVVELPGDWPDAARCAAVMMPGRFDRPVLVAQQGEESRRRAIVTVYEPTGATGWTATTYTLPDRQRWSATQVAGQLIVAQRESEARVAVNVLRRGQVHRLASIELPDPKAEWIIASSAGAVEVIVETAEAVPGKPGELAVPRIPGVPGVPGLSRTVIDLTGRVMQEMTPLTPDPRAARAERMQYVMMGAVVVMSLLMLFIFWQRDPRVDQPRLDERTRPASLWKRAAAGAIDLAPPAGAVIGWFDLTPGELGVHWQQLKIDPSQAGPALTAIGLFVAYTMACELLSGTTPGKRVLGLRVSDLDGGRPRVRQVVVRGLLKALDLLVPLLLTLALLSVHRQRLGDLAARTVVTESKGRHEDTKGTETDDE